MNISLFALVVVLLLAACKKEPKPAAPAPASEQSVPISNNPARAAEMIGAARRVAGEANAAGQKRVDETSAGGE